MPMTIVEKILAAHAGEEEVEPGQLLMCRVDVAPANDVTAPLAIKEFVRSGAQSVFDRERLILVMDHYVPNKDIKSAEQVTSVREFASVRTRTTSVRVITSSWTRAPGKSCTWRRGRYTRHRAYRHSCSN